MLITVRLSQRTLAGMVGASRENVNRALMNFAVNDDLDAYRRYHLKQEHRHNHQARLAARIRTTSLMMHPPRAAGSRQPICSARATMMPAGPRR